MKSAKKGVQCKSVTFIKTKTKSDKKPLYKKYGLHFARIYFYKPQLSLIYKETSNKKRQRVASDKNWKFWDNDDVKG